MQFGMSVNELVLEHAEFHWCGTTEGWLIKSYKMKLTLSVIL